jgi:nucleoside-diphosphate-sugar epimerase
MVRLLITGGTGYLGTYLIDHFNPKVNGAISQVAFTYSSVADEHLPSYYRTDVSDRRHVLGFKLDLSKPTDAGFLEFETFLAEFSPDVVLHAAAKTQSNITYDEAYPVNVEGTRNLAKALMKCSKVPLLIHFSTDWVYSSGHSYIKEDLPVHATTASGAYGRTKLESEEMLRVEFPELFARTVILRSALILGPRRPNGKRSTFLQWLYDRISAIKDGDSPVEVFADEWRSPIFLPDVMDCLDKLVHMHAHPAVPLGQVYNMGGPRRISRLELADALCKGMGIPDPRAKHVRPVTRASAGLADSRPEDLSMDSSKLANALPQWKRTSLDDGIRWFLDSLKQLP